MKAFIGFIRLESQSRRDADKHLTFLFEVIKLGLEIRSYKIRLVLTKTKQALNELGT